MRWRATTEERTANRGNGRRRRNDWLGADTTAIKRVDADTTTAILKTAGKTVATVRAVVSKDGKVTAIATKGTSAQGQPISITTVWDKQPSFLENAPYRPSSVWAGSLFCLEEDKPRNKWGACGLPIVNI